MSHTELLCRTVFSIIIVYFFLFPFKPVIAVAEQVSRDDLEMTRRLVTQRLVSKALQVRKEHVGLLLGSLKSIKSIKLNEESDFGKNY